VQAVLGKTVQWGDSEYLLAMAVDWMAALHFLTASVYHQKGPRPKPPTPVRRPGDIATADGETGTVHLEKHETIVAGSLSPAELDRVIEAQTGAVHGIAKEE